MNARAVAPARGPVSGVVRVPGSKSLTHRALTCAALARGESRIGGALFADDTLAMLRALRALGCEVEVQKAKDAADTVDENEGKDAADAAETHPPGASGHTLIVRGTGGRLRAPTGRLDLGGSGTAIRFLTALAALAEGEVILDGDARLRQRPMEPLLRALRTLGVDAHSLEGNGSPPISVRGGALPGGAVSLPPDVSSQFVSALLLVAPLAKGPIDVVFESGSPLVSRPYVDLTIDVMARFGIAGDAAGQWRRGGEGRASSSDASAPSHEGGGEALACRPAPAGYQAAAYEVPPDASSASYFFASAAITGGRVDVPGLSTAGKQPDLAILTQLQTMGCRIDDQAAGVRVTGPAGGRLRAFDADLRAAPDLAPALAVLALFADGASRIRNASHVRLKESDRIAALAAELTRVGAKVDERPDGLTITPRAVRGARIETYRDHRIAMAFAVAGLVIPGIEIADPGCVSKSFPEFWETLDRLVGGAGPI